MINKKVQADIGNSHTKQKINEDAARSTIKNQTENIVHTAADIGSRATKTAATLTSASISGAVQVSEGTVQTVVDSINQRTSDIYDVGYYGNTDLSSDGAAFVAGNAAMVGQNTYRMIRSGEGTLISKATDSYYRSSKINSIKEKTEAFGNPKSYPGHYYDILLGRSRKDIASLKDRMAFNRTQTNKYSTFTYRERIQAMSNKFKSNGYHRALQREKFLQRRAEASRRKGFSLQRSIKQTVNNQSRKLLNSLTTGDDAITNKTMFVGQKTIRGIFRTSEFTWRYRKAAYKGTKRFYYLLRHPLAAARSVLAAIVSMISMLVSLLANIPVIVSIVAILLPLIIVLIVVVTVISSLFGWLFQSKIEVPIAIGVSEEVRAYEDDILSLLDEYWDDDYLPLVMAVMMQESAGKGCDPMGVSLSPYNKEYPKEEAGNSCSSGITDSKYSIKIGIIQLRECLSRAAADGATDLEAIEYALQGYNMGLEWFDTYSSPWSEDKAKAYSEKKQKELNVDNYGDPLYPKHVMRYYSYGGTGQLQSMPDFSDEKAWVIKNPYAKANLYGQCTWFVWGKMYEIYGWAPSWTADGRAWVSNLVGYSPNKFSASSTPKVGAIFSALGINHVGIVVGWDGNNITIQEGNLDGITNTFEDAKSDWHQVTYTLEQLNDIYGGVIFANPIEPIEME